ncbi:hypothetical protein GCM10027578_01770 [Spirosoma luteolum]
MAHVKGEKHHIVPRVYLNGFTNENGEIFKHKKEIKGKYTFSKTNPPKISYKPNFYKFEQNIQFDNFVITDQNVIERYGFWYENNFHKLIGLITRYGNILSTNEATSIAEMLYDIKIRNEYIRNASLSTDNINKTFDKILEDIKEKDTNTQLLIDEQYGSFESFLLSYEQLRKEWLTNHILRKDISNFILLSSKLRPSDIKKLIINKIVRGEWKILKPLISDQFITSDNPGFCQDINGKIHNTRFGEIFTFYFPLTPYHCLQIQSEGDFIKSPPSDIHVIHDFADKDTLRMVNSGTYLVSNREIYAKNETHLMKTWYNENSSRIIT